MRIVDPTFGTREQGASVATVGEVHVNWQRDRIGFFSNSKPNADLLLQGVEEALREYTNRSDFGRMAKLRASQPAADEHFAEAAAGFDAMVLALAD